MLHASSMICDGATGRKVSVMVRLLGVELNDFFHIAFGIEHQGHPELEPIDAAHRFAQTAAGRFGTAHQRLQIAGPSCRTGKRDLSGWRPRPSTAAHLTWAGPNPTGLNVRRGTSSD